jgi:hypothetical protein
MRSPSTPAFGAGSETLFKKEVIDNKLKRSRFNNMLLCIDDDFVKAGSKGDPANDTFLR